MNLKTYQGKPELLFESDDWKNCGYWVDEENNNIEWFVFFKHQEHNNDWVTYKVVANGRVPSKANYWFVMNKKTGNFGFAKDLAVMAGNRPNLHMNIMRIISEEF